MNAPTKDWLQGHPRTRDWLEDRWAYLSLVLALALPIEPFELPSVAGNGVSHERSPPATLDDWDNDEVQLLIEEGRRHLDLQGQRLDGLRLRAQLAFTTALALLAALISLAEPPALRVPMPADVALWLGLGSAIYSALGAAAVVVVGAAMGTVHASHLAAREKSDGPILRQLAMEYSANVKVAEGTINTRMTVFFEVVCWLLAAAGSTGLFYLLS